MAIKSPWNKAAEKKIILRIYLIESNFLKASSTATSTKLEYFCLMWRSKYTNH